MDSQTINNMLLAISFVLVFPMPISALIITKQPLLLIIFLFVIFFLGVYKTLKNQSFGRRDIGFVILIALIFLILTLGPFIPAFYQIHITNLYPIIALAIILGLLLFYIYSILFMFFWLLHLIISMILFLMALRVYKRYNNQKRTTILLIAIITIQLIFAVPSLTAIIQAI